MFIGIPWAFKVKTYRTVSPAILLAVPERERKKNISTILHFKQTTEIHQNFSQLV